MTAYKHSLIVVMENGAIVHWSGFADDTKHAEGLAIEYAQEKEGCQVWDLAFCPVIDGVTYEF